MLISKAHTKCATNQPEKKKKIKQFNQNTISEDYKKTLHMRQRILTYKTINVVTSRINAMDKKWK